MAAVEVTSLPSGMFRRSSRLTTKIKPLYINTLPINEKVTSMKKRGRSKREKPAKKNVSTDNNDPKAKKVIVFPSKTSKKKLKLDFSHKKPLLEGTITEDIVEDNNALDQLPVATKSSKTRVKETSRAFTSHYLHSIQEEKRRDQLTKAAHAEKKSSKPENEEKQKDNQVIKRASKQPDLKAIKKMLQEETVLNRIKRLGHIPGIEVGDQFFSRAEMVVVGLHSHCLNGIDYMGKEYKQVYEEYTFPLANCIVLSGQYQDGLDNADNITYTGQGGHDLLGNKKQISDQKLERGNLALKNNYENNVPVRVIRGHKAKNSYTEKIYTYDGLYKVVSVRPDEGMCKFTVFKYELQRLEGQKQLTTSQVCFVREDVLQSTANFMVSEDISNGLEKIPIPATNTVDDPPYPPSGFVYTKKLCIPSEIKLSKIEEGCKCRGDCASSPHCCCAKLNGNDFAYVRLDGGRLVEAKSIVFECGANCKCGPDCLNRTSQKGIRYRLEVFKTAMKGWAVRSWDTIPAGAPVCEYTGILKHADDIDINHCDNKYIFDIDDWMGERSLTYDYGYAMDSVVGPDGEIIKLDCHCGAADCPRRLH